MTELPEIAVDPGLHVPPYEQIRQQLADLITGGVLATGHRLPPIRQLAADLGLAAGTVARAYQELEAASLVHTRRAAGTVVAALSPQPTEERSDVLARQYVQAARRLGLTVDEALAAVSRHWTAADPHA
ncbi:GntR family transcriptional regulator [Catellatospora tritici]|uniref:GntR family transcriptional regulator n=1 Tax=Catellatospora tritici TaxID=2851566 RepID=UPI001C2CD250|nr:GntR family transcriptional regulator [Catellatospora tritici]MBV1855042.1 GntR family transcriptional regulator [Catellatospora tritici]